MSRWLDPAWRADAVAWVEEALAAAGLRRSGELEQPHVRPWGTAIRVPVESGAVWLKANGPGSAYEARLVPRLARWWPDLVLDPLAVEPSRGWLLLRDGGPTLRTLPVQERLARWERILVAYATAQVEAVQRAPELLALGLPDLRPERLLEVLDSLLRSGAGGSPDLARRLGAAASAYEELCTRLSSSGIPPSVEHGDLHDANVFVEASTFRIFDWGDASVAHPFFTLLSTLRSVGHMAGLASGAPELLRLRDAYLEPWSGQLSRRELVEVSELALRAAAVQRGYIWHKTLAPLAPAERGDWTDRVPGWLAELFEPDVLTGRRWPG